jgi:hypothetical protein
MATILAELKENVDGELSYVLNGGLSDALRHGRPRRGLRGRKHGPARDPESGAHYAGSP